MTEVIFDPASFKDPAGRVFHWQTRVFRTLSPSASEAFHRLEQSGLHERLRQSRMLVGSTRRDAAAGVPLGTGGPMLEHERVPFITYPYEWSFDMLRDAAILTLDLLKEALRHEFILKDGTAFNVQFVDGRPLWIDVLSLVPYTPGRPWEGYAQFCSTQLYPLLITAYRGVEFQPLLRGSLRGISAADAARLLGGWRDLLRPGVLKHVILPARLERTFAGEAPALREEFQTIRFSVATVARLVEALRRVLDGLRYDPRGSQWAEYADDCHYAPSDRESKERFVEAALATAPDCVWDLGANTGTYAAIAARRASRVVAIDADPAAVNRLYLSQKAGTLPRNIQPLVGDITDPSPALGWSLKERRPWSARGRADFFLALALIHHLAITGNVPLEMLIAYLASVAPAGVVEFVDKSDPMVQRLMRNRDDVFDRYTLACFEQELARHFRIEARQPLSGGRRTLYRLGRR